MERLCPAGSGATKTDFTTAAGETVISVEHSMATPLDGVGLQVWRGALLLADYILHHGAAAFGGATALELGCGPGLTGLVLSRLADTVFLTDTGEHVLANCQQNVEHNMQAMHQQPEQQNPATGSRHCMVAVRQLNWLDPPDFLVPATAVTECKVPASNHLGSGEACNLSSSTDNDSGQSSSSSNRFAWRPEDEVALQQLDFLLAADCVYEDNLTECLMRSAVLLMQYAQRHSGRSPLLLVGLERRIVFTMIDTSARAPAYDYWRTLFEVIEDPATPFCLADWQHGKQTWRNLAPPPASQHHSCSGGCQFPLVGWRLDATSVPQLIQQYDRSEFLELWALTLRT